MPHRRGLKQIGPRNPLWIAAAGALGGGAAIISQPAGFNWTVPITVAKSGLTYSVVDFDIASYAPTGKAYYVNGTTGSDSNDGLTPSTALQRIYTALGKSDIDVLYIAPGIYDRSKGWAGTALSRSVAVYQTPSTSGDVIITNHAAGLSWVLDGTYTNTYKATRSSTQTVLDVSQTDANGDYAELTHQVSAAAVDANAGSWYMDGSNVVWVRTSDDRPPDADIWPLIDNVVRGSGNITLYLHGLTIIGGNNGGVWLRNSGAGQTPKLIMDNIIIKFASTNGVTAEGVDLVIAHDCTLSKNKADGFNYHTYNSVIPHAIEIDCTSRHNGAADDNDNGSSMHDGGSVVRVSGFYNDNIGPNIVDIGSSESWNLGVTARASAAATGINYQIDGTMWLDGCISSDSDVDLVTSGVGDVIYTRNLITGGNNSGSGTITTY